MWFIARVAVANVRRSGETMNEPYKMANHLMLIGGLGVHIGRDFQELFVCHKTVEYQPNARTERRGRPSESALSTDVARPRSLQ